MQSNFNEKLAYSYPCKPTETCIDYDDYDPCESNEDITEKDLAILLKEEAAKLEREKERAAKECEAESEKKAKETSDAADGQKQKLQTPANDAAAATAAAAAPEEGDEENVVKKKICKYIKNPFFTDRLKLSTSHLPLPPPGPPPQNLPLAEDGSVTKICPRKKKKCKKLEEEKIKKPKEKKVPQAKVEEAKFDEDEDITEEECLEYIRQCEEIVVCEDDSEAGEEAEPRTEVGFKSHKKKEPKKKKCKKEMEVRPPCKKKESEVSVNFGPRKIPLQQKDLPQKSPKDIPEVENQILMACGKNQENQENCKKKCKKKDDKVK